MRVDSGAAEMLLERRFEGNQQSVSRSIDFEGTICVVAEPRAHLEEGPVWVDDPWWAGPTSWREATVVLDNSRSNVPVEFRVVGPNGVDRTESVGAGESLPVPVGPVEGRHGATFQVTAVDLSTELVVARFTGMPDWCAPRIVRGQEYAVGDIASWRSTNYRFVGEGPVAEQGEDGSGNGLRRGWWRSRWEPVSACEYR
jgi:hypothetical protein